MMAILDINNMIVIAVTAETGTNGVIAIAPIHAIAIANLNSVINNNHDLYDWHASLMKKTTTQNQPYPGTAVSFSDQKNGQSIFEI